jgi:hypothetical protein
MLDNLNARDGSGDAGRERPRRASEQAQPLSDREVPLGRTATSESTSSLINQWLDGEGPEPVAVNADAARQVDLWRRIEEESERRRHLVTPAHVKAQIMAALPADVPQMALPWWKKSIQVSPVVAIAAAAGLVALGAAIGNSMRIR